MELTTASSALKSLCSLERCGIFHSRLEGGKDEAAQNHAHGNHKKKKKQEAKYLTV